MTVVDGLTLPHHSKIYALSRIDVENEREWFVNKQEPAVAVADGRGNKIKNKRNFGL